LQAEFYASSDGLSTAAVHKKAEQIVTAKEVHDEYYDDGAPFWPLSKWKNDGFDVEAIVANSKPWNVRTCPVLGLTYRVPILTVGNRGLRGTTTESKVTIPKSAPALPPAAVAPPLAIENGQDQGTSDASAKSSSSNSSSSSSSSGRKSKRGKKAKKSKKAKGKSGKRSKKDKKAKKDKKEPNESKAEKKAREAREKKEAKAKDKADAKEAAMNLKYSSMVSSKAAPVVTALDAIVVKPEFQDVASVVRTPLVEQHGNLTRWLNDANKCIAAAGRYESDLPDMQAINGAISSAKRGITLATQMMTAMIRAAEPPKSSKKARTS
jgi:hypothetical protein